MTQPDLEAMAEKFADEHAYSTDCLGDERKIALHAFEAGLKAGLELAADYAEYAYDKHELNGYAIAEWVRAIAKGAK